MNNFPTLSIIVPTYNSSKTIYKCLKSVFSQTFINFEVLIIDGISTDDTLSITKGFSDKYSNVEILSEKDSGIYDAMNKGIKLAKGKWLYFLGSDDSLSHNQILEELFSLKSIEDCDVFYGSVKRFHFDLPYAGRFNDEMLMNQNICHQSIFFRKSVFNKIGLFNLNYPSHADWDNNMRWFYSNKVKKIFIDKVIADYSEGGFSSNNFDVTFERDRTWNYLKYNHARLKFKDKFNLLQSVWNSALKAKFRKRMLEVIIRTPYLLLST